MITMDSIPVPADSFSVRKLGEETIILAQEGESIHSLDEVGTFFWETIDGKRSLGEILPLICAEYDADEEIIRADLLDFIADLAEKGILNIAG